MDPHRCEPSQSVRRIDVISTTILLDVSVDDSEIYAPMDISYDGNMSCDGETPNHINSNSTWIFLRVVVTVATYFFSETIS